MKIYNNIINMNGYKLSKFICDNELKECEEYKKYSNPYAAAFGGAESIIGSILEHINIISPEIFKDLLKKYGPKDQS